MLESRHSAPFHRAIGPIGVVGATAMRSPIMRLIRGVAWLLVFAAAIVVGLMAWGGGLLIATDPLPEHANAAIVLQGSVAAERARLAAAIDLLQRGIADRVLLSVPKESFWGQSIPPVARTYIERTYGNDLAVRVDFCETSADVNSTAQEVQALSPCIQTGRWRSLVIVTSNYHTRRAGILWRRVFMNDSNIRIWIDGVADPEFGQPWWRHRQSAKIWLSEISKLSWTILGGR